MNILITNDDGINTIAIKILAKELSSIADVYVIAPDKQRSGNSHHTTIKGDMRYEYRQIENVKEAIEFWGTPADCVQAALCYFFKDKIDLVVTGINYGANLASDIVYSGTDAAAREAHIKGLPAIALSVDTFDEIKEAFECAAKRVLDIIKVYMEDKDNTKYFLNVNVPNIPDSEIKGIKVTKATGVVSYKEIYEPFEKDGTKYLRKEFLTDEIKIDTDDPEVDFNVVKAGYISITPLDINQLCREYFDKVTKIWKK